MTPEETKKLLDRLSRIEGQIRGLRNMLEDGRCCEDVLTQLLAARSGLESASVLVLEKHLNDCVLNDDNIEASTVEKVRDTLKLWSRHTSHAG